jgi:4a-hydroxytetrahydrobiopterin dehydratase
MELTKETCEPCEAGTLPLSEETAQEMVKEIPLWTLKDKAVEREFQFKSFREAIHFINRVAVVAEDEGHHPDIHCHYNKVLLELSTHKIGGLSRNDFIVAAKIDRLLQG